MRYDLVIAGGGLAGCTLAKTMAAVGARVLVLERETVFRDRVRGEAMHPWGVAEARILGIYQPILDHCGRELRWWDNYDGSKLRDRRNLVESTPGRAGELAFYHPEMQELVLQLAEAAGAEVRRGSMVVGVEPGTRPAVVVREQGRHAQVQARLVVGADGRNSRVRSQAGFAICRDGTRLVISGLLLAAQPKADQSVHFYPLPSIGQSAVLLPLPEERLRAYCIYRKRSNMRQPLSGQRQFNAFKAACVACGVAEEMFVGSQPIGPLAEYEGADIWVDHPYREGVVLIGDAAAASDPAFGCGLSLALKDVRTLRDALLAEDDWGGAAHTYAAAHDCYYAKLHRIVDWHTTLLYDLGPEADARRERAFGRHYNNKEVPDLIGLGPDSVCDEAARRRFLGEEPD